jgi:hypothetical protein
MAQTTLEERCSGNTVHLLLALSVPAAVKRVAFKLFARTNDESRASLAGSPHRR